MYIHSWFRRIKKGSPSPPATTTSNQNDEQQLYGITDDLIDLLKSFTLETFKNFDLQEEQGAVDGAESTSGIVQKDLSDWQEKHAVLVLSKVKELSQLRFKLCPRYLKERQFWRIYFTLVKNHVAKKHLRFSARVSQIITCSVPAVHVEFSVLDGKTSLGILIYELHAIRLETLKQIAIENKKDPNTSAYEVEMLEARKPTNLEPVTSLG